MLKISKEVNSKIDWKNGIIEPDGEGGIKPTMHSSQETLEDARKHYFDVLRSFLNDVHTQAERGGFVQILEIFKDYNIYFVDVDDIKRVNIDEPLR